MAKDAALATALSIRQELFVDEYVKNGGNGTAAYCKVWECDNRSYGDVAARRLIANDRILGAIHARRERIKAALGFGKDEYIRILHAQATFNPGVVKDKIYQDIPLTLEEKLAIDCEPTHRKASLSELAEILRLKDEGDSGGGDADDNGVVDAVLDITKGRKKA